MALLDALCSVLLQQPRVVLAAWLVVAAISAPFAPRLVDRCKFSFDPIKGTPTFTAFQAVERDFPAMVNQDVELVLLQCAKTCPKGVAEEGFAHKAVERLRHLCEHLNSGHPRVMKNWTDHFQYEASAAGQFGAPSPFLSASRQMLLFQITWTVEKKRQNEVLDMLAEISAAVEGLNQEGLGEAMPMSLSMTGPLALFSGTLASTKQDIAQKDVIVVPFAMLVLAWRVRSIRLLLAPLLCLGCSLLTGLALFLPLATYVVDISPLAPSTMAFLSVALSIDYSLFMLTRYVEEATRGLSTEEALRSTMRHSGHVVVISSSVLVVCYMGVLCYPSGAISTIGMGAALVSILSAGTNLTLTPCLIAAFPGCFGTGALGFPSRCSTRCSRRSASFWPRIAKAVTTLPGLALVPLVALAVLLPACGALLHYRESLANTLTFPAGSKAGLAYEQLLSEFPAGQLNPQFVLLPADDDSSIRSEAYFDASCRLAQRLMTELATPPFNLRPRHLLSPSVLPRAVLEKQMAEHQEEKFVAPKEEELACLRWRSNATDSLHPFGSVTAEKLLGLPGPLGEAYREQWSRLVSSQGERSALTLIVVPFDPYSDVLRPFVIAARKALVRGQFSNGVYNSLDNFMFSDRAGAAEPMLFGELTIVYDVIEVTYKRLPFIICGTILLVFALIAAAFKAAFAPVKMFFTVVVPLAAVYGVAVLVYQDGALSWLPGGPDKNPFMSPPGGGFYWATPVFTCTIIIGLALDYDIFLFARVVELRHEGLGNRDAVCAALCLTGPTITAAGLVMSIAFFGLLLSSVPANNQIGFVMGFGVLMDTFVIRTCLVPACLTLAASLNYWPHRLPPVSQCNVDEIITRCGAWGDDITRGISMNPMEA